jgi:peptidoglycan/LPS O-acetylase OafA/YrhL
MAVVARALNGCRESFAGGAKHATCGISVILIRRLFDTRRVVNSLATIRNSATTRPGPVTHGADKPNIEPVRALTAVRGLAAWWVVVFHFRENLPDGTPDIVRHAAARGYLAVDLFFILSGYVIALNYGFWFSQGAVSMARYGRFLLLRLSRIYPLHLFILLLFLLNPVAIILLSSQHDPGDLRPDYYVLSVVLMQGWGIVGGSAWNVPAWSISAEWLAYLLFPALVSGVFAMARGRLRSLACVICLLATIAVLTLILSPSGLGNNLGSFGLVRCLTEFSLGIAVFRLDEGQSRPSHHTYIALAIAAACCLAAPLAHLPDYLVMPLCFVSIVYALADERGPLATILRNRPLQWLGAISYSTYLIHYLLKIWIGFALVRPDVPKFAVLPAYLAVVLACSGLLYRWIERPSQKWWRAKFLSAKSPV